MNNSEELAEKLCPACFDDPSLDLQLLKTAADYAAGLSEDLCVAKGEYLRRMAVCEKCENLSRGVCGKCGCFVIVRAKRRNKSCPLRDDRWKSMY